MIDRESILKDFKNAAENEVKQRRKAELALDIKPFRGGSWALKPHYKWSWKLNKAVRV
ncbi:coil containing protein [Vibrio phage 1.091.O._10N.286.52.B12]|nr:coil containing protein [Vibrio phage 1.091.O._10N.286.52.B12]